MYRCKGRDIYGGCKNFLTFLIFLYIYIYIYTIYKNISEVV